MTSQRGLLNQANPVTVKGPIGFAHQTVDMSKYEVSLENGTKVTTCPAALVQGFSGTLADGPRVFPFTNEGEASGNPYWDLIRSFITVSSPSLKECQHPKPILLPLGEIPLPYEWAASIVETAILRVGNLYIICFPGELTTMAGRRLREEVKKTIMDRDGTIDAIVVNAGLCNTYTHYTATFEEYQVQRYEGASTLYGPHTLAAHIQQFKSLAEALMEGRTPDEGPELPLLLDKQISLQSPILIDTPLFGKFGDCIQQPPNVNLPGDIIAAKFVSGNPGIDPRRGGTFCTVEYKVNGTKWEVVATDASWSTQFRWFQLIPSVGNSESECKWEVPLDARPGSYRICHFGRYKNTPVSTRPYEGCSNTFQVVN